MLQRWHSDDGSHTVHSGASYNSRIFVRHSVSHVVQESVQYVSSDRWFDADASSDVGVWSIIEPCIGILMGSLPYLRPLFDRPPKQSNSHKPNKIMVSVSEEYSVSVLPVRDGHSSPTPGCITSISAGPKDPGADDKCSALRQESR